MTFDTSFGRFAQTYDAAVGDTGDYTHRNTVDPPMLELAGSVSGAAVYDLACGNGYLARRLVRDGAREVWASDISSELVSIAETKYPSEDISYSVRDAADFGRIPREHFDLVIMNMAVFYVWDLERFAHGVHEVLKPDGRFLFSLDHPLRFVAYEAIDAYDVDIVSECEDYLAEKARAAYNMWTRREDLNIYSRPVSSYINACGGVGLLVRSMREPPTRTGTDDEPLESSIPHKMVIETVKVGVTPEKATRGSPR